MYYVLLNVILILIAKTVIGKLHRLCNNGRFHFYLLKTSARNLAKGASLTFIMAQGCPSPEL